MLNDKSQKLNLDAKYDEDNKVRREERKQVNDPELVIKDLVVRRDEFQLTVSRFEIKAGEIFCLMGRSGSGKSTLLNAISGFLPIEKGQIHCGGRRLDALYPEDRKIALVFQRSALFPHLTVAENIEFSLRVQRVAKDERRMRVRSWLEKFELSDLSKRRPHQISGGQAQRVALARAFITGFPVILLDEPFASLDTPLRSQLRVLTQQWVRETKMIALIVSHDPEDVWQLADRVAFLDDGNLKGTTTPGDLKEMKDPLFRLLLGMG